MLTIQTFLFRQNLPFSVGSPSAFLAKQFSNVRYNKATLAFIEAGSNDTKNYCYQAVDAVIANFSDDKLLFPCYHFARSGVSIEGRLDKIYRNRKYWKCVAYRRQNFL